MKAIVTTRQTGETESRCTVRKTIAADVLFAFLYAAVRLLMEILIVRHRSKARLEAEVLALRHQLCVRG